MVEGEGGGSGVGRGGARIEVPDVLYPPRRYDSEAVGRILQKTRGRNEGSYEGS